MKPTEMQILNMLIKQRREAADMFRKGGREELAAKEEAELAHDRDLPACGAERRRSWNAAVAGGDRRESGATSAKEMGKVMKAVQAKLAGKRVDGKVLSERVKSRLA